jgi:hypothetical protein
VTPGLTAVGVNRASVESYEELRHGVLTGVPGSRHGGVIVLVREGVAAWLAHGSASAATASPVAIPAGRPAAPAGLGGLDASLVRVLATMALANRTEVHP